MTNEEFILAIAPIIQKYAVAYGYKIVSAVIAQACVESAYGRSTLSAKYHNYFGLKCGSGYSGASVNMATNEEYRPGTLTSIRDNFRVYGSMDEGVKGYYEFIQYARYSNLRGANSARDYLERIKAAGYATSSTYVNTCMNVVNKYNLELYDRAPVVVPVSYAGIITADALRVRLGAGTQHEIMNVANHPFLLPRGFCVAIDAECNGWGKLAGINGWCSLDYIKR